MARLGTVCTTLLKPMAAERSRGLRRTATARGRANAEAIPTGNRVSTRRCSAKVVFSSQKRTGKSVALPFFRFHPGPSECLELPCRFFEKLLHKGRGRAGKQFVLLPRLLEASLVHDPDAVA